MVNSYVCTSDYCLNLSHADIGAKKQFEILRGGNLGISDHSGSFTVLHQTGKSINNAVTVDLKLSGEALKIPVVQCCYQ